MRSVLFAVGLTLAASSIPASADTPAEQLEYFLGTWNCVTHAGGAAFSESRTITAAPGSVWLHASGTLSEKNHPLANEDTYLTYDSRNARFVLLGITSAGAYFIATSSSPALDGSKWTDAFPDDGGAGTLVENSASQYTSTTVAKNGMTTQTICTRR